MAVLHPDVILRADFGRGRPGTGVVRGARAVAKQARPVPGAVVQPALVNGVVGAVITLHGKPFAVMGFVVVDGRIVEIDAIADPARLQRLAAHFTGGSR